MLAVQKELSLKRIAKEIGVSKSYISNIVHGRRRSRRIQEKVAQVLGSRFEDLFISQISEGASDRAKKNEKQ